LSVCLRNIVYINRAFGVEPGVSFACLSLSREEAFEKWHYTHVSVRARGGSAKAELTYSSPPDTDRYIPISIYICCMLSCALYLVGGCWTNKQMARVEAWLVNRRMPLEEKPAGPKSRFGGLSLLAHAGRRWRAPGGPPAPPRGAGRPPQSTLARVPRGLMLGAPRGASGAGAPCARAPQQRRRTTDR